MGDVRSMLGYRLVQLYEGLIGDQESLVRAQDVCERDSLKWVNILVKIFKSTVHTYLRCPL